MLLQIGQESAANRRGAPPANQLLQTPQQANRHQEIEEGADNGQQPVAPVQQVQGNSVLGLARLFEGVPASKS